MQQTVAYSHAIATADAIISYNHEVILSEGSCDLANLSRMTWHTRRESLGNESSLPFAGKIYFQENVWHYFKQDYCVNPAKLNSKWNILKFRQVSLHVAKSCSLWQWSTIFIAGSTLRFSLGLYTNFSTLHSWTIVMSPRLFICTLNALWPQVEREN